MRRSAGCRPSLNEQPPGPLVLWFQELKKNQKILLANYKQPHAKPLFDIFAVFPSAAFQGPGTKLELFSCELRTSYVPLRARRCPFCLWRPQARQSLRRCTISVLCFFITKKVFFRKSGPQSCFRLQDHFTRQSCLILHEKVKQSDRFNDKFQRKVKRRKKIVCFSYTPLENHHLYHWKATFEK